MSWARVGPVPVIATRREPFPEQATTPLTLTSILICSTCQAAGTSSPAPPRRPRPCATSPGSNIMPTTTTGSLSTRPTWCHHNTTSTTTSTPPPSSARTATPPPAPFPTRIIPALCLVITLQEDHMCRQLSNHSSNNDQAT